jgi:hypothetical protein
MNKKKEYRIVKAYPNSPAIGKTISWSEYYEQYIDEYCVYYSERELQNKEFFELVEEKQFEILEVQNQSGDKFTLDSDGRYYYKSWRAAGISSHIDYDYIASFESYPLKISKVLRKKDNIEISLGDKLKLPAWKEYLKVIEIKLEDDTIKFHLEVTNERGTFSSWYSQLELVKEPKVLFVSADGVDIKEGMKTWMVYKNHLGEWEQNCDEYMGTADYGTYFHSIHKALEFIDSKNEEKLLDSKVLSYNSVVDIYDKSWNDTEFKDSLKELVKSKQ